MEQLKKYQQHLVKMLEEFEAFCTKNQLEFMLVGGSALGAYRHSGFIPWDDDIDIAMLRSDFEKMEQLMRQQANVLGHMVYSPVENAVIPEAPIGHLYDFEATMGTKEYAPKIDIHPLDGVPEKRNQKKMQKICALIYYLGTYHLPTKNKGKLMHILSKTLLILIPESLWNILIKKTKEYFTKWDACQSENICSLFGTAGYEKEVMPRKWLFPLQRCQFEQFEYCVPCDKQNYLQRLYGDWQILPPEEKQVPVHESFLHFKERDNEQEY